MENFVTNLINDLTNKINSEKERLLKERLSIISGVNGLEIDLEKEIQRTFPRITCRYSQIDHSETYFWNDGTEFGNENITFYPLEEEYDYKNFKITSGFRYK